MLEFIVLIVLVFAFAFLLYPIVTIPTFFINVALFIIIALRARVDLMENKMHIYYLWSAFFTAVLFVAKEYGTLATFSDFLFSNKVLYPTQAVIMIFLLAHLFAFIHLVFRSFLHDKRKAKNDPKASKINKKSSV